MTQINLTTDDGRPTPLAVRRLSRSASLRGLTSSIVSRFGWSPSGYLILSLFAATLFVIGVVWWPLVEANVLLFDWSQPLWPQIWLYMDWLLLGVFAVMSLLIMAGADIKADALIVFVGLAGGLVIESWGTQTHLWTYFTLERPPLWIIPAWPIAGLSIDRLYRFLALVFDAARENREGAKNAKKKLESLSALRAFAVNFFGRRFFRLSYWLIFPIFYALMLLFVWPTLDKSLTIGALILCALLILTPTDHRAAVLTFAAGAGLGYFLELWGTTRECWTYYTRETPPLFAVLAHGMAAVAFWRVSLLIRRWRRFPQIFVFHLRSSAPSADNLK